MPGEPRSIDLNADIGEAGDDDGVAVERSLLRLVSSAHIACGGHAGNEESMRATVQAALAGGVRIGAHPSYPDRAGFGRRSMGMAPGDLSSALAAQLDALVAVTTALGGRVHSIKAHGALYGEVGRGASAYEVLVGVMAEHCDPDTALVLPSGAPAVALAREAGVTVLQEGFADRAYAADGSLVGRNEPGSVYAEPALARAQALALAMRGAVTADDGRPLTLEVDTICVHGDSPNAPAMARAVRAGLAAAGITVIAPSTHS